MKRTLWFTRGDGQKFACEEGSEHQKMMVKEGFELDEELSDPPTETVENAVSEVENKPTGEVAKPKTSPKKVTKPKATKAVKAAEVAKVEEVKASQVTEDKSSETTEQTQ